MREPRDEMGPENGTSAAERAKAPDGCRCDRRQRHPRRRHAPSRSGCQPWFICRESSVGSAKVDAKPVTVPLRVQLRGAAPDGTNCRGCWSRTSSLEQPRLWDTGLQAWECDVTTPRRDCDRAPSPTDGGWSVHDRICGHVRPARMQRSSRENPAGRCRRCACGNPIENLHALRRRCDSCQRIRNIAERMRVWETAEPTPDRVRETDIARRGQQAGARPEADTRLDPEYRARKVAAASERCRADGR